MDDNDDAQEVDPMEALLEKHRKEKKELQGWFIFVFVISEVLICFYAYEQLKSPNFDIRWDGKISNERMRWPRKLLPWRYHSKRGTTKI